ncbi:MAG: hypothetical protein P4L62_02860 [Candidatus Pacebacteria bacterium]|nr:hypothetical protein [Candidatus Paceibacterota bacterium]MDR3583274.1 hypothetical protein [Candidatus Paceibacterota bacterium]
MFYIILALYAIIILIFVFLYFFIIYHLAKYSINASLNKILLPLFIVISTILLFSNVMLFFSVNWNGLLSQVFNF